MTLLGPSGRGSFVKRPGSATHFSTLTVKLCLRKDILLMSVGWLAREGRVILKPLGDDYHIALRKL